MIEFSLMSSFNDNPIKVYLMQKKFINILCENHHILWMRFKIVLKNELIKFLILSIFDEKWFIFYNFNIALTF